MIAFGTTSGENKAAALTLALETVLGNCTLKLHMNETNDKLFIIQNN